MAYSIKPPLKLYLLKSKIAVINRAFTLRAPSEDILSVTAIFCQPRRDHHGMIISSPNRSVQRESYDESHLYLYLGCHLYVPIAFWPTPSRRPKLPCAQLARTPRTRSRHSV